MRLPGAVFQFVRSKRQLPAAVILGGLALVFIRIAATQQAAAPTAFSARPIEASLTVPAQIETIFSRSCKDCHSNDTHWPWYSRIAPLSWFVSGEIARARSALNLSEWPAGPKPKAAIGQLTAACAEVESKRMPPATYARLGADEIETLCEWTGEQTRMLRKRAMRQKSEPL